MKTYSELMALPTYQERFEYLRIGGYVGEETFGFKRYLNQKFYKLKEWKNLRNEIIARDLGNDMGDPDHPIQGRIIIHHINPITIDDVINRNPLVLDPENLICVSNNTHQAIHYGDESLLPSDPIERSPNDQCPWR